MISPDVSRYGNDSPEFREISAKMLATCLHMMQGTYIYQGEELGMTNIYFDSIDDYKDIECIDNYRELTESGLISKEDMIRYLGLEVVIMQEHLCNGDSPQCRIYCGYTMD